MTEYLGDLITIGVVIAIVLFVGYSYFQGQHWQYEEHKDSCMRLCEAMNGSFISFSESEVRYQFFNASHNETVGGCSCFLNGSVKVM